VSKDNNELPLKPISAFTAGFQEKVQQRWEGIVTEDFVKTGFKVIDEQLGGLAAGELIICGGRPASGKTSLAQKIAYNIAEQECGPDEACLLFSMEMTESQNLANIISQNSKIKMEYLKKTYKGLSKSQRTQLKNELEQALDRIDKLNLLIDTSTGMSAETIRQRVKEVRLIYKPKAIFVDYLTLLAELDSRKSLTENVTRSVRILHEIGMECKAPVFCLAQLNRSVETDPNNPLCIPEMKHLRDSSGTEQEASVVMFVYRPAVYLGSHCPPDEKTLSYLMVAKNRQGQSRMRLPLRFIPDHTRFVDVSPEEYNKLKERGSLEYN
jgi:replicative DNA helicase